jgi:Flp pilus assembly pilin Flp
MEVDTMLSILRYAFDRLSRDESGAELPEWVIWVAVLATVGALLVTPVQNGLVTAFTTVLAGVPGVGGGGS